LPLHANAQARVDARAEVSAIEPDERQLTRAVVDRRLEARPGADGDVVDGDDLAAGGLDFALNELRDAALGRLELVVAGEILQQVAQRLDAQGTEGLGPRGPDA